MWKELGADHYDKAQGLVGKSLVESPWLGVYAQAADFLATGSGAIADIGCGTGRFARLLWLRGERDYLGVDFSAARIDAARRYAPEMTFEVGDVYSSQLRNRLKDFRRFAMLEILEHIEDDLGVLKAVPSGALVVFSVPTYDSAGHVRYFSDPHEAARRYGGLLSVDALHAATLPLARRPDKKIYVMAGRRL